MKNPEVGDWIVFNQRLSDNTKLFIYEITHIVCGYNYHIKSSLRDFKNITLTLVYPTDIFGETYTASSFQGMKVIGNPKNNPMLSILYR